MEEHTVKTASVHTHFQLGGKKKLPYAVVLVSVPTDFHDCAPVGDLFMAAVVQSFMGKWAAHVGATLGSHALNINVGCAGGTLNLAVVTPPNASSIRITITHALKGLKAFTTKGIAVPSSDHSCKRCVKAALQTFYGGFPKTVHVRVFAKQLAAKKSERERMDIIKNIGEHEWAWKHVPKEVTCPNNCNGNTSSTGLVSYKVGKGISAVLALQLAQMVDGGARLCGSQLLAVDVPLGKEDTLKRVAMLIIGRWKTKENFVAHCASLALIDASTKHTVGASDVDKAVHALQTKTPL